MLFRSNAVYYVEKNMAITIKILTFVKTLVDIRCTELTVEHTRIFFLRVFRENHMNFENGLRKLQQLSSHFEKHS